VILISKIRKSLILFINKRFLGVFDKLTKIIKPFYFQEIFDKELFVFLIFEDSPAKFKHTPHHTEFIFFEKYVSHTI